MGDGNAIIKMDLGKFSKPATVLIQKVAGAIGLLYEPTHLRRKARAQADVNKIKAIAKLELGELEQRALQRLVSQEVRKQENIESIVSEAIEFLPENAQVEELNEDWVAYMFKQCDTVSDTQMRSLWAKILAAESTSPGKFSKRTLNFLSGLSQSEAELFTALGAYVWQREDSPLAVVRRLNETTSLKDVINGSSILQLQSLGLITYQHDLGFSLLEVSGPQKFYYFDREIVIDLSDASGSELDVGEVALTTLGAELWEICGAQPNYSHYYMAVVEWRKRGYIVSEQ
ncbi:DUF2806 domain-containing protein [Pararobbsia alpina]|uniref:DUF2806 domain-containing protein n=1 Tax=Pararobbsia alpina TaxID=621374 RepID=A0A6S7BCQ0_9BURK|nr:DUF2806 domain-containing protein [Pararobbsia alpina]CAB3795554.1 hypothetical protein LMG28138_03903 [Pararobbsia alpina]